MSTAFSGIDAPGAALTKLYKASMEDTIPAARLRKKCGPTPWQHVFAIDMSAHCRQEMSMSSHPPQCCFADMTDFISGQVRRSLLGIDLGDIDFERLKSIVFRKGLVTLDAPCTVHNRHCRLRCADVHVAGSPCTDWSAARKRLGLLGTSVLAFLIWAAQRLILEDMLANTHVMQIDQ